MQTSIILIVILLLFYVQARNDRQIRSRILRRKQGRKRKMPTELMKEFLGKVCTITLFNELSGVTGRIAAVEDNWIKVEEKNRVRLVNGDMIRDIVILPEKHQK